ncbi:hypothetical protein D3C71_1944150 [compost metagenome]
MVGQICGGDHRHARPHGVQFIGHRLKLDRIARQQGHMRALGHQCLRHSLSQAAGAAADQRALAGESKVHVSIRCHEESQGSTWSHAPPIARPDAP